MASGRDELTPLADVQGISLSRLFAANSNAQDKVRKARHRISILTLTLGAVAIVLIARSADLAVLADPKSEALRVATKDEVQPRARLIDRNGALLAANIKTWDVYVRRVDIDDPARLAARLSRLDGVSSFEVLKKRLSGKRGRARIARSVTPRQRKAIFELAEPGIEFEEKTRRIYPGGRLASHLLGWVNADGVGAAGVEHSFDERLQQDTSPLRLSIDSRVQFSLEDELRKAVELHKPIAAVGIVTHIPSGEILAMASLPDFDPNHFNTASPDTRRNRALTDPYELGSVFKPLTMAMALESGMELQNIRIDVNKKLIIAGREIRDFHPGSSPMSATDILVHSSNKGAARLALAIGSKKQRKYLQSYGLLDPAPIDLKGSADDYMASSEWSQVKTATIGFGHGLSVTPLSFVAALSAIVNNGQKTSLKVLAQNPKDNAHAPQQQVVSAETSLTVRRAMREVVLEGSGRRADVPGYGVAGKTGSAEKWDPKISGYARDRNVSSFVAVFPWESPEYMVFVLLDEPQGGDSTFGQETAGWNAAPTVHNIIKRIGPLLNAPYSSPNKVPPAKLIVQAEGVQ